MKKILLVFYFTGWFCYSSFAQPVFSKKYLLQMLVAQLIAAAPDDGYYFCGQYNADLVIGKTDSLGNLQWAKQAGQPYLRDIPVDMTVLSNGNAVIAAYSDSGIFSSTATTYVMCFDNNGINVFTKKFINTGTGIYPYPKNIIRDADGFSISISNYTDVRLLRLDSMGNKLNSIYVGYNLYSIYKTSSGGYLLNGLYSPAISKLNSSFNYIGSDVFLLDFDPTYYGLLELSSGSFILYGSSGPGTAFICKTNSQLQYQWAYIYSLPNPAPVLGKIGTGQQTASNSLLFAGGNEAGTAPLCNPYLLQIDTLGNIQQFKFFDVIGMNATQASESVLKNGKLIFMHNEKQSMFQIPYCFKIDCMDSTFSQVCNLRDTTAIIDPDPFHLGGSYSYPSGVTNDSLLADTMPVFNISFPYGDCSDTTLMINQIQPPEMNFQIYPNPANDFIFIRYNLSSSQPTNLSLFNIYGQKLKTILNEKQPAGAHEIKIDLKDVYAGIYFVKMIVNGKEEMKRIVKTL